jgi:hypothetical protein
MPRGRLLEYIQIINNSNPFPPEKAILGKRRDLNSGVTTLM